jgi:hypothetical protein
MRYRSKHNYSSGSRSGKGQKCRFGRALITYSDLYGLKDWEFKHIGIARGEIDYVTSNPDIDPRVIIASMGFSHSLGHVWTAPWQEHSEILQHWSQPDS